MDPTKNLNTEEQIAEDEKIEELSDDDLRDQIIEEYGLDPEDEMVGKLLEKEQSHRKKLSEAIGQKIKYRSQLNERKPEEQPSQKKDEPKAQETPDVSELVNKQVQAALDEQFLEQSDYSDDLKGEIRKIAAVQGISMRKAANDQYISWKKEQYDTEQRVDEATITRKPKGAPRKFDPSNPPKVDMSTEEGRKQWEEWKRQAGTQQ